NARGLFKSQIITNQAGFSNSVSYLFVQAVPGALLRTHTDDTTFSQIPEKIEDKRSIIRL
ncbi:MAG: hypothetical protein P8048_11715, partial [Calditrichia bacterium]